MLQVAGQEPQHRNRVPATRTVGRVVLDHRRSWVRARAGAQRARTEHAAAARRRATGVPEPVSGRERHALPGKAGGRGGVVVPHRPNVQQVVDEGEGVGKDGQVSSREHVERAAEAPSYNCTAPPEEKPINQLPAGSQASAKCLLPSKTA